MSNNTLLDRCRVCSNYDVDTFVGIKCEDGDICVNFPLGYNISSDEKEIRKDILLLISTIASSTARKDSELYNSNDIFTDVSFPIKAYIDVIYDYYARGYYVEREVNYSVLKRGKINWNRTIKTQKPLIQDGEAYYLDYVVRKNEINDNQLITLIHEYCVYESFDKIGWLFFSFMPSKPRIKFNKKLFKDVVMKKLLHTFNDKNKRLFKNMLAIIEKQGNESEKDFFYGTYRFEYVWEYLIDRVYGITNKNEYFPKTTWTLDGNEYDNASLEPDTIMIWNNNIYVLDAKYYKYGATKKTWDLPNSTSINKQITYGEYIANNEDYKKIHGEDYSVYNAFIMPYDKNSDLWNSRENIDKIGEATSSWKSNNKSYEKIQGIVVDVKHLMRITARQDEDEILQLAKCIEEAQR